METIIQSQTISAEELLMWEAEGKRYEIIEELIVEKPMTNRIHGKIGARLIALLQNYVDTHNLGEVYMADVTYVLEGTQKRIISALLPDVSYISAGRLDKTDDFEFVYIPPDLAVEIISPSERPGEVAKKLRLYLKFGTQQVWTIYPEQQVITVYGQNDFIQDYGIGDSISLDPIIPNLMIEVAHVFKVDIKPNEASED